MLCQFQPGDNVQPRLNRGPGGHLTNIGVAYWNNGTGVPFAATEVPPVPRRAGHRALLIKVVTAVNGDALIALLAAIAQFKDSREMVNTMEEPAWYFFAGLMFAILSAGLSYIYQCQVT